MATIKTDESAEPKRITYSADELAVRLGVSPSSIWRGKARGELKAIRLGGRTLFFDPVENLPAA